MWDTWQAYYLCVLRWSSLKLMFSGLWQKDRFKGEWSSAEKFLKQNCCHACHTRFAVFFFFPVLLRKLTIYSEHTSGSRDHRTSDRREGSGLQEMIRENSQKTFSFRFRCWKVRRPFRSSFILIINSLEWFSELEHLKNILEINDGHVAAKKVRILLEILTYWQPYKYEGHEKIQSIRSSLSGQ